MSNRRPVKRSVTDCWKGAVAGVNQYVTPTTSADIRSTSPFNRPTATAALTVDGPPIVP